MLRAGAVKEERGGAQGTAHGPEEWAWEERQPVLLKELRARPRVSPDVHLNPAVLDIVVSRRRLHPFFGARGG